MKATVVRASLPVLAYLWVASALVGAISAYPIHASVPTALDQEIFSPGRMMLLEHVRVSLRSIGAATASGFFAFVVGQLAIWLGRSRLSAIVIDSIAEQRTYRSLLSRAAPFIGIYLLQVLVVGLTGALTIFAALALPSLEGTLNPTRIASYLGVFALGCSVGIVWTTYFEVWRLALFFRDEPRPWSVALQGLTRHLGSLLTFRSGRAALSVLAGLLVLRLTIAPLATGPWGALVTYVLVHGVVGVSLVIDVLWLTFAGERLLWSQEEFSREQRRRDDRSARAYERIYPTPNPDASRD